jgi:hypothetical protein
MLSRKVDGSSRTFREHLEALADGGDSALAIEAARDLAGPGVPAVASHVWEMFGALSLARSGGMAGPNPIGYAEIEAWSRLTDTPLDPDEVMLLRAMDIEYLAATYELSAPPEEQARLRAARERAEREDAEEGVEEDDVSEGDNG